MFSERIYMHSTEAFLGSAHKRGTPEVPSCTCPNVDMWNET